MKSNIKSRFIGLLIVGSVSLNFNLKVFTSIVDPVSDATAKSVQGEEAKLASSLPRPSMTQSEESPKAVAPAPSQPKRAVTYSDLLNIVDIGASAAEDFTGLSVSPDNESVAFEEAKTSVKTNKVETRWIALSLSGKNHITDLGAGGEFVPLQYMGQPVGGRTIERPLWLPDSQWIVFRARFNGSTQLWRSRRDGKVREQLTHAKADVERFQISRDGKLLLFSVIADEEIEAQRLRQAEADRGYLYDERFSPLISSEPLETKTIVRGMQVWVHDPQSHLERLASQKERLEFEALTSQEINPKHWLRKATGSNASVWLEADAETTDDHLPRTINAQFAQPRSTPMRCRSERCRGHFKGLWITEDGKVVYFLRWQGAHDYGPIALYAWVIGDGEPKQILETNDLLQSCSMIRTYLLCSQESAVRPAHVVKVNLQDGSREVLYDPNSYFNERQFGEVVSLRWKDKDGVEGFGHLVKPVGYQLGARYPLVIVQYRSRGFLRGGVGDEYPIHVLASKGFNVLSFHRPDDWKVLARPGSNEDRERYLWRDQRDRRRVLSVLTAGIDYLDQMGVIDPSRVGISGLSDGANTATYALIHSGHRFAAAAVAGTYWNPMLYYLAGPALAPQLRLFGLNSPDSLDAQQQWRQLSIALNASSIQTPILIQVSDAELLPETETMSALQRSQKAVEMHVFRGEFHIKSQPRHRLNVYRRNVQWFLFWLSGVQEIDPVDQAQYQRWNALRARQLAKRD